MWFYCSFCLHIIANLWQKILCRNLSTPISRIMQRSVHFICLVDNPKANNSLDTINLPSPQKCFFLQGLYNGLRISFVYPTGSWSRDSRKAKICHPWLFTPTSHCPSKKVVTHLESVWIIRTFYGDRDRHRLSPEGQPGDLVRIFSLAQCPLSQCG